MSYYKITNHARGSLLTTGFSVNYSQHYWVRGIGKLFVFDSLQSVYAFRGTMHKDCTKRFLPVWKCEVRNPEPLSHMAYFSDYFEEFWESFPHVSLGVPIIHTPAGTLVVSTLKLLERVC